jgi:hypothetical protein
MRAVVILAQGFCVCAILYCGVIVLAVVLYFLLSLLTEVLK